MTEIIPLLQGSDNYCYVIKSGGDAVVIDASFAEPVLALCARRNLTLRLILSTHHHGDHTSGNSALRHATGCKVVGGDSRISSITTCCKDDAQIDFSGGSFRCIAVPGHTTGSFAFYYAEAEALFTGDTLFYAGCGRLFEGTAATMYQSLVKLSALPDSTKVYGGHEYTLGNLAFARTIEPENHAINERVSEVTLQLEKGGTYGPATLEEEHATNPFLRCGEAAIAHNLGLPVGSSQARVFELLRKRKDDF